MTAPGDPISTLGHALTRYTTAQDAAKEHAQQLTQPDVPPVTTEATSATRDMGHGPTTQH